MAFLAPAPSARGIEVRVQGRLAVDVHHGPAADRQVEALGPVAHVLLPLRLSFSTPSTGSVRSPSVSRFDSFPPSRSSPLSTSSARAARTTFTVSVRAR